MESVLALKELAAAAINQKLLLQGIGWDFYEEILKEFENSNALHFAYDDGILEVEVPTDKHEFFSRILAKLIDFICAELEIEARNYGSTTFRQKAKTKGVEPDECFYIQNESKIRGNINIDLAFDPPPDLVIEIDVTSPSLPKLPIYAALGVPEVWLYKGERVEFFGLDGGEYRQIEFSDALPMLSSETATEFLEKGLNESSLEWIRAVREWARDKK